MSLEQIYKKAINQVIEGSLTVDELWEVLNEHIKMLEDDIKELQVYETKYNNLLELVSKAYKEHLKGKI
jgi:hypothetical protein